jgi:mannose-1-phosphate guanylyltransferase/mannose-6-phosphate isomerase
MKSLILAGGSGTRLWPVSRSDYPKQFLKLDGVDSLLQKTLKRNLAHVRPEDLFILTNSAYYHDVKRQVGEVDARIEKNILLEPSKKNTGPAIALALKYVRDKLGASGDEVMFVCPSDHMITPEEHFTTYLAASEVLAKQGSIVTLGVHPSRPEVGYGYIKKTGEVCVNGSHRVERFVEKPDAPTAQKYLMSGEYLWNSGMFAFTIDTLLTEIEKNAADIHACLQGGYEDVLANFGGMPDISIDYAVMEKSDRVVVLPLNLAWSDVGSWDNVYDVLPKDENQNVKVGHVVDVDTKNCLILGGKRLVSTIGLENLLVVETDDVVLIAKRSESQKEKQLVERLKLKGRKEVSEHVTSYRPWGSYTVLENSDRYKMKKITVNPLQKLSLQMHYHRSEHWVVVKGTARVTIGDKQTLVHENESIYVPKTSLHRVENPGKIPLEIIEVQVGEYLDEDDIVRFEDVYGR